MIGCAVDNKEIFHINININVTQINSFFDTYRNFFCVYDIPRVNEIQMKKIYRKMRFRAFWC